MKVAAIAFCLKHDVVVRAQFLRSVCGIEDTDGWKDSEIEIEEKQWGDLIIVE